MGSNVEARLWLGVPCDKLKFKDESFITEFLDEYGEVDYWYDVVSHIVKTDGGFKGLDISHSYDDCETHEKIFGFKLTNSADWSPLEIDLSDVHEKEKECLILLTKILSNEDIETYLVPSYF